VIRRGVRLAALWLACLAPPAVATPVDADAGGQLAALNRLQADDRWLHAVGWRLVQANAPFCEDAAPAIGLLVQDMAGYGDPAAMRGAAGITGDFAVHLALDGTPAQRAGLATNDELLAIDGLPVSSLIADLSQKRNRGWERLARVHDTIEQSLRADGEVEISWRSRDGTVRNARIAGVPTCPTRFELFPRGSAAAADGVRVVFGRDFSAFSYPEELWAASVAHELAHNVLHHRATLARLGRKVRDIRLTEREADRLSVWLIANAGYEPEAALRYMERWGPAHDMGFLRERTHDGWDERRDAIAAEIPLVRAAMAETGKADWRRRFRREIEPPPDEAKAPDAGA